MWTYIDEGTRMKTIYRRSEFFSEHIYFIYDNADCKDQ